MNDLQFNDYSEARAVSDTLFELTQGMIWIQEPTLKWKASDGFALYQAWPDDMGELKDQLHELPTAPVYALRNIMNIWAVETLRPSPTDPHAIRCETFAMRAGVLAKAVTDFDPHDPDLSEEQLAEERWKQIGTGGQEIVLEDYAYLDNAIFDLKAVSNAAYKIWMHRKNTMTDQEKFLERLSKFAFLSEGEIDKNLGPAWWSIGESRTVYAVRANSPEEAAALVDIHHEEKFESGLLPLFDFYRHEEDVSKQLDEQFPDGQVIRLIPFSTVPYPDDMKNLTPEQQAAFDALRG